MTDAELRELDAEVAVRLFGWSWWRDKRKGLCTLQPPEGGEWTRAPWGPDLFEPVAGVPPVAERYADWDQGGRRHVGPLIAATGLPRYSRDVRWAWAVVDRMKALGHTVAISDSEDGTTWSVFFLMTPSGASEDQPTVEVAICRSALLAAGTR